MRAVVASAIFLLGVTGAAQESEFPALYTDHFAAESTLTGPDLVEIESSVRGDRLTIGGERLVFTADEPHPFVVEDLHPDFMSDHPLMFASADAETDGVADATADGDGATNRPADVSMDDLCKALFNSAQNNDLPIPFFANLIWQESRMRPDDVSKKGAEGIAQFMPKTALEKGLGNPFDPLQAIPASARFLHELRLQFGNLGFVAAAYNAGPRRVAEWLERRGSLPQETRTYVVRVTGLSVDTWRGMPVDSEALTFVRPLPCRGLPAYASVEQTQSEEAQLTQAKLQDATLEEPSDDDVATVDDAAPPESALSHQHSHGARAERRSHKGHGEAARARHPAKREAAHAPHAHEKRKSA
jgi:hypothetical protein